MRSILGAAGAVAVGVAITLMPTLLSSQILVPPDRTTTIGVMSNGPAPTGVRVDGTPTVAKVSWSPVSGAVKYTVMRAKDGDPACCNAQSGEITGTSWTDNGNGSGIQWSGTYVYTIVAWQSTGVYGQTIVKWTRPEPLNPSGFTSKQTGEGTAELSWQAVPGASYYWIWGPGTGTEGVRADGTSKVFTGIGSGAKEWSITTRYDPSGFLLASSTWPKTQLNMVTMTGNYRITLNGFQVMQPVADNVFFPDGVGDEVFSWSYVRIYDRTNGAVLNQGPVESAVHGDTEGYSGRVPAGTLKPTGGLQAGDKFPSTTPWTRGNSVSTTTFPLLLWEGPLTDAKEAVVITPFMMEWNANGSRAFIDYVIDWEKNLLPTNWGEVSTALSGSSAWSGPTQIPLTWGGYGYPGPSIGYKPFKELDYPRGIGGVQSPRDKDRYVIPNIGIVFTRELIEKALNSGTTIGALGPGVIQVNWQDQFVGSKANYVLYIQVARQ